MYIYLYIICIQTHTHTQVDAAEHPKFGSRVDLPLVQEEEQQLLLRIRAQMGNAWTGT